MPFDPRDPSFFDTAAVEKELARVTGICDGCRRCHDLTYTSCQDSHKYDRVWRLLAGDTGYDPQTVKWAFNRIGKPERTKRRRERG